MFRSVLRSPLPLLARALPALCLAPLLAGGAFAQGGVGPVSPREVRALGRLERADLVPVIRPFLDDSSAEVRSAAADALAQSTWPLVRGERGGGDSATVAAISSALRARLATERDPAVVAAIARSLGRLPYRSATERRRAERTIVARIARQRDAEIATGAARGIESLVRIGGRAYSPAAETIAVLRSLARHGGAVRADSSFAWPRRLAMMSLIAARAVDSATLRRAMTDADPRLRRLAAMAAGAVTDTSLGERSLRVLLEDRAPMVRIEALLAWSRIPTADCSPLLRAARDSAPHVSLTAIDAIGARCEGGPGSAAAGLLDELVGEGAAKPRESGAPDVTPRVAMHRAAHALVALAHVAPVRAAARLGAAMAAPAWQTREYAARAAAVTGDTAALEALAGDDSPNVRTEAVTGLATLVGHAADDIYIRALAASDYQLVFTAAHALRGTPRATPATSALLTALARLTAEKRETSRDPRMAILQTLSGLGSAATAGELMPYLVDFDPVVADSAAATISRWSGREYHATPRRLPEVDQPLDDIASYRDVRVRFTMAESAGAGSFEIRLFPDEAPATVSRFARLVREGYYDGLTVHRVVPNFVVQGGSPGANEYVGDGPFMRDEVGLRSHERGTLGISTRGRDTGDAQFFINLVDNPRLDHEYTVFGAVVAGMSTVDQLLEGDVMARVEIIAGR